MDARNENWYRLGKEVKAKTEELLYLLLWACDMASRPTFQNLNDSFMSWAYRRGFLQQLARLEKRKFLESQQNGSLERVYRLTEAGRVLALGGRDPELQWNRNWDDQWRMIIFDIPQKRARDRLQLRRALAAQRFGFLQNSVWITPDPMDSLIERFGRAKIDVESLTLFNGRPCGGESDADIVAGSWSFEAINDAYKRHSEILMAHPPISRLEENREAWRKWFTAERQSWLHAIEIDPLLPRQLHPRGYQGREALRRRQKVMKPIGHFISQFTTDTPPRK